MSGRLIVFFLTFLIFALDVQAQPISQQLRQFSPLAEIYIRNLGMEDKNGNGLIDECRNDCECKDEDDCEGFNQFVNRYGIGETYVERRASVDRGFHANGVIVGVNNGRLEENEIINHYYINIRFKPAFTEETTNIESERNAYVYANNIPLVWLDDEQGTVMRAVTRILGEGWNDPNVERTEDEAVRMFTRAVQGMRIAGRTGTPSRNGGYHTLPEMVNRRAGYCFEVAQFGFWFFSELRINSVTTSAFLTSSILHDVIELTETNRRIDYFAISSRYRVASSSWNIFNPIRSIGSYYAVLANKEGVSENAIPLWEQAVIHDRYDIAKIVLLMGSYDRTPNRNPKEIITLGEFFLDSLEPNNFDAAVRRLLQTTQLNRATILHNLEALLCHLLKYYAQANNRPKFENLRVVMENHFPNSRQVRDHIRYYSRLLN